MAMLEGTSQQAFKTNYVYFSKNILQMAVTFLKAPKYESLYLINGLGHC